MAWISYAALLKFIDQAHPKNIGADSNLQRNERRLAAGFIGRASRTIGFFRQGINIVQLARSYSFAQDYFLLCLWMLQNCGFANL